MPELTEPQQMYLFPIKYQHYYLQQKWQGELFSAKVTSLVSLLSESC
jgi:hypothetical protein